MDGAKKPRNTMMALIARLVVAAYLLYTAWECLILSTLLCVRYMEQKFGVARAGIYCIKEGKFVRSILFYPAFKIFILGL